MLKIISITFLFCVAIQVCSAQEEMSPAEKKQQTLVTEPLTVYKGFFRVQLSTYYAVIDKIFIDSKKQSLEGNIWGDNFSVLATLQYGVSDRFMVEATLPYVRDRIFQSSRYEVPLDPDGQFSYPKKVETNGVGIGDMDIALTYQLITEAPSRPAIAAFVRMTLPTGEKDVTDDNDDNPLSYNTPTGQGEIAVNPGIRLRKVNYPFAYGGTIGYTFRNEVTKVTEVDAPAVSYKNGNFGNVSGFINATLNDWVSMRNFVDFFYFNKDQINGEETGEESWLLQYSPGFSFQVKKFRFDQFVSIPIKANFGSADPTYILVFQYTF